MKRYVSVAAIGLVVVVLLLFAGGYAVFRSRPQPDARMLRARALVDTENYLSALEELRALTASERDATEVHSYLGAAYMQLHLYKAAIDEFEQATRQSPRTMDAWLGLAATHIRLGDGQRALEDARKAADLAKDSTESWLVLGRAHWLQRNFAEAEKAALKVLDLEPANPQAVELLLHVYFDQEDESKFRSLLERTPDPNKPILDVAVQFFVRRAEFRRAYEFKLRSERRRLEHQVLESQLALAREPSRVELYPNLVRNLVRLGRYDEAVAAASAYRGPVSLDLELGKAYASTGRKEDALRAYARASAGGTHKLSAEVALAVMTGDRRHWQEAFRAERVEQDYFVLAQLENILNTAAPLEKAFIYRYMGVYDGFFYNKAAEQALDVLNAQPGEFDALMTIATAYQRLNRIDDALRYVEQARTQYANRSEPWSRLGGLALIQKDVQKALPAMERAAQLEPSNPTYLYNAGWLHEQLGDMAQALNYYQRAIAASSLSFEAMNNLALMHENAGRSDLALNLLRNAVLANPDHEAAYFNLADYYAKRGSWREALGHYRRILEINPLNVTAAVETGRILLNQDRIEQAIIELNRALEIDAHAFDAYLVLSSAYEKLGHGREALAALDEAKRIRPDDPAIQAARDRLKAGAN